MTSENKETLRRKAIAQAKERVLQTLGTEIKMAVDDLMGQAFNDGWDAGYEAALKKKEG